MILCFSSIHYNGSSDALCMGKHLSFNLCEWGCLQAKPYSNVGKFSFPLASLQTLSNHPICLQTLSHFMKQWSLISLFC